MQKHIKSEGYSLNKKMIVWSAFLLFGDVGIMLHMFRIFQLNMWAVKFFVDIVIGIILFVTMVMTYGRILMNRRTFGVLFLLETMFGCVKVLYYYDENGIVWYKDMKYVLFAIFSTIVVMTVVRIWYIGLERISGRELPQVIFVLFMLMAPAISKLYLVLDIAVMMVCELLFIMMLKKSGVGVDGQQSTNSIHAEKAFNRGSKFKRKVEGESTKAE